MIPEEAVEVAAKALWENQTGMDWESKSDALKALMRNDARAALEAATPYMQVDPHAGFVAWFRSLGDSR